MALAKAFPDTYMYELHEPTSTTGFRYPRPASVPPSPALSRHSSPHHSEAEDEDERYDEDVEAEKDRVNIRQPYALPVKNKYSAVLGANGNGDGVTSEKNWDMHKRIFMYMLIYVHAEPH